jgi:hypothetical protein
MLARVLVLLSLGITLLLLQVVRTAMRTNEGWSVSTTSLAIALATVLALITEAVRRLWQAHKTFVKYDELAVGRASAYWMATELEREFLKRGLLPAEPG